jgi:hypothetical protein
MILAHTRCSIILFTPFSSIIHCHLNDWVSVLIANPSLFGGGFTRFALP